MSLTSKDTDELNLWSEKPFWCQPWSIILTGILVIIISLIWPAIKWITLLLSIIIVLWWILFLWLAPNLYRAQIGNIDQDN
ncbi:DUF6737 family protein [Prochlorococcus sp. MIT 1307]|uniref:DUF6737 family protein n=1 Tax=Prochlorococcus sp. MIT 1307 TaxID=3096219 RepID=UPI002A74CC32|nr:DUF6737 family protein [Prochlorococcus sp. MIT 1307]